MRRDLPDPVNAIARSLRAIRFEDLPPATVACVERLVLDSVAVALAGSACEDARVVHALVAEWGGNPQASLIGSRLRAPAPAAALANGTAIQALDFDDTHDPSATHVASTVLAAALACAELRGASGAELLAAVTAGVELAVRLGRACDDNIGFTSTAVYGAFGAAAASAHVLGLDENGIRNALGIVLSQAAGSTQTALDWPLSKHMQSGFMAQAGVLSALLASRNVSGISNVFEGKYGFMRLYKSSRYSIEPLMEGWGSDYAVHDLSLKPFPSCRATHAPIEAAMALFSLGVDLAEVESVRVIVPKTAAELSGKPFDEGTNPVVSAQFSIMYTVATALLHGSVSLAHFKLDAIRDPRTHALMERIEIAVAEGGGDFVPARVELVEKSGRSHTHMVSRLKGSPEFPLDEPDLLAKIADCLAFAPPGVGARDARELKARIAALAAARDVKEWTATE